MPFICSFPFYKLNASEESLVNDIPTPWIPEGFFPPPGKEETADSAGQGDKAGDKEYSRIEHVCNGSKVPLAYNSWKQLATGKRMLWLSWRALKATRKNDRCGLCAILDDAIGRQEAVLDSNPEKIIKFVLQLRLDNGEHFVSVHPKRAPCLRVWVKGTTVYKDYFLYTSEGDPAARDIATRPPCSNLSEEGACHLSLKRISECIMNHTECQKPKPVGLPARVIDCFDPTRPRLIITNGHISSYLALSYVCGESTDTSRFTRESNIDEYTSFINPSVIPRTILDAIHLTHGLGQMYLWVDAFCIIQDSPEDRSAEIACTGRIFGDAFLTIIAARSPHADAGISLDFLVPDYYEQHPKLSVQEFRDIAGGANRSTRVVSSGTIPPPSQARLRFYFP
ncbi:hypothetical protein ONZ45_g2601 [Pleurotus djamor]|nr:hypothetical protein ONZ45_g2601 [Pleurotus djamor]